MKNKIEISWVVVIILIELILLHCLYSMVYDYANLKSVVDAFGFGGTLVGILVGFIAIIYAFYQGAAQQQTNNTMVAELTKLAGIKEDIAGSALALRDELKGLSAVAAKLADIEKGVVDVRDGVRALSTPAISGVKPDEAKQPNKDILWNGAKEFLGIQTGFYLAFSSYVLSNRPSISMADHGKFVYSVLREFMPETYEENQISTDVFTAIINLTLATFSSFNIVEFFPAGGENSVPKTVSWVVNPQGADGLITLKRDILDMKNIDDLHLKVIKKILS